MRRAAASCSRGAPQGSGACPDRRGFGTPLQRQRWEAVSCNLSTAAASASYPGAKLDLFNQEEAFGRAAVTQPAGEGDGGSVPLRAVRAAFCFGEVQPRVAPQNRGAQRLSPRGVTAAAPSRAPSLSRMLFKRDHFCQRYQLLQGPRSDLGLPVARWSLCMVCPGRCPRAGPWPLQHRLRAEQALLHGSRCSAPDQPGGDTHRVTERRHLGYSGHTKSNKRRR